MSHVRNMVGRLHVGTSTREVIRYLRSRIKEEHRTGREAREARHAMYREGLEAHAENGGLYDSLYGRGSTELEAEITATLYGGAENREAMEGV